MTGLTLPFQPPAQGSSGPLIGITNSGPGPAIAGTCDATVGPTGLQPIAVAGYCPEGMAVYGQTNSGSGVYGQTTTTTTLGTGVLGCAKSSGQGVVGVSVSGIGVQATSITDQAINAYSAEAQAGYFQTGGDTDALVAQSSSKDHAAVSASGSGFGVWAYSDIGFGVWGHSDAAVGVHGESNGANPGVSAVSTNGPGLWAQGSPAGYFDGDVQVTGDLVLINSPAGGDIAEDFDLEEEPLNAEPGTVLVIGRGGKLSACAEPYDTRVAGVVSGAGDLRPAVVLQRLNGRRWRSPIALLGKVVCKVDAAFGSIEAGDLLTTSPTPGRAMKVTDRSQALGAVLGKALRAHDVGAGMVPILVSLR
jgi:hypothetical protein